MTTDCPTGARREGRRLAVVASSLAAGAALAAPSSARAEPVPDTTVANPDPTPDSTGDATAPDPTTQTTPADPDSTMLMGIPASNTFDIEMGVILVEPHERPAVEWSI